MSKNILWYTFPTKTQVTGNTLVEGQQLHAYTTINCLLSNEDKGLQHFENKTTPEVISNSQFLCVSLGETYVYPDDKRQIHRHHRQTCGFHCISRDGESGFESRQTLCHIAGSKKVCVGHTTPYPAFLCTQAVVQALKTEKALFVVCGCLPIVSLPSLKVKRF